MKGMCHAMQKIKELSAKIWEGIQQEDVQILTDLVHPNAVYVHMGVTLSRDEEIQVILDKKIVYKTVVFEEQSIHDMGATVVVLNKILLTAVVNGLEVVNPFVVTESYTKDADVYKLAAMSYTRINYGSVE